MGLFSSDCPRDRCVGIDTLLNTSRQNFHTAIPPYFLFEKSINNEGVHCLIDVKCLSEFLLLTICMNCLENSCEKYRSLKGQEEDHSQMMNIIKFFLKEEQVPCHLNGLSKQKDLG